MAHAGEHIIAALKAAREEKGLSQRELSRQAGVPQSHISKIEQGTVDLQLSSLIELSRVLDLEIMTVPRKLVPAVQAIVSGEESASSRPLGTTLLAVSELKRIEATAKRLHFTEKDPGQWRHFQKTISDLVNLRPGNKDIQQIREVSESVRKLKDNSKAYEEFLRAALKLQRLRNSIAHRSSELTTLPAVRPAYSLDEDADA